MKSNTAMPPSPSSRRPLYLIGGLAGAFALGIVLLSVSAPAPAQTPAAADPLTATNYQLVSERRISRTVSELSYRVTARNTGPLVRGVKGHLTSSTNAISILDNSVSFAELIAGGTATSDDTFTIRQDRTRKVTTLDLTWQFIPASGVAPGPTGPVGFANPTDNLVLPSLQELGGVEFYSPNSTAALNTGNVLTPPDITMTFVPNTEQQPLTEFLVSYSDGWYSIYENRQTRLVDGRQALLVDDSAATVQHFPVRAVLIADGDNVVIVTGEQPNSPTLSELDAFLATLDLP